MTLLEATVVLLAGIGAGTMNTIVGSGTLLTFPTLVLLGVPPLTANVSNTIGLAPGSLSGAIGYRRELAGQARVAVPLAVLGGIGGIVGGVLLFVLPDGTFDLVVPVLIAAAVVAMVVQPRLAAAVAARRRAADGTAVVPPPVGSNAGSGEGEGHGAVAPVDHRLTIAVLVAVTATGVYGGYFGAAQGVILLAVLGIMLPDNLQRTNGLKNVQAFVANATSAVLFAFVADVDWAIAGLIAVGSVIGGQVGAHVGRRLSPNVLRAVVVLVGLAAVVHLLTT